MASCYNWSNYVTVQISDKQGNLHYVRFVWRCRWRNRIDLVYPQPVHIGLSVGQNFGQHNLPRSLCISGFADKKLATLASDFMYSIPSDNQYKQETLKTVNADLYHNLDIVNLLARLRMHGFALALLFDQQTFKLLSSKSKVKPLKHPSTLKNKHLWR